MPAEAFVIFLGKGGGGAYFFRGGGQGGMQLQVPQRVLDKLENEQQ